MKNFVEPWRDGSEEIDGPGRARARRWAGKLQRGEAERRCSTANDDSEGVALVKRVRELLEGKDAAVGGAVDCGQPGGVRRSLAPPLSAQACRDVQRLAARLSRLQEAMPGLAQRVGLARQLETWVAELEGGHGAGADGGRSLSKWCGA